MSEKTTDNRGALPPSGVWETPETQVVATMRVACDGGEAGLGHPRVWLQIPEKLGWVECGYCDKRFVHEDHADEVETGGLAAPDTDHEEPYHDVSEAGARAGFGET